MILLSALVATLSVGDARFPALELENWDGRPITSATLEGKTTIVVPTYAKCVFACPMITFFLTELDKELGSPADVQYLHVSVNPDDDTAEEIESHFEDHGIDTARDPRWLFANAPKEEIERLLDKMDVEVTRTRVEEGILTEHTVRVFVVGPSRTIVASLDTYFWDQEEMHHAMGNR